MISETLQSILAIFEAAALTGATAAIGTITVQLSRFLLVKGQELLSTAAKNTEDTRKNLLERLEGFVMISAANTVEREFPKIANQILLGKLASRDQVRTELVDLGLGVRKDAINYFNSQDIDIVDQVGVEKIDQLIEAASNKVSPFPGMRSSAMMMLKPVANAILHQGTEYVRQNVYQIAGNKLIPAPAVIPVKSATPPAVAKAVA